MIYAMDFDLGGLSPVNFKGWVLGLILGTIGRHVLASAFDNSVKAIEARNGRLETPPTDRRETSLLSSHASTAINQGERPVDGGYNAVA